MVWLIISLTRMMKILGNLLAEEQANLKIIMITWGIGLIGSCGYMLYNALKKHDCSKVKECASFIDLMITCGVWLFFDVIPTAVLYY